MDQNFLKFTYHLGSKKINAYLKMPSPTFHVLKKEIEMCLFEERKQPRCEIRSFWIDEDHDEIEIVNQCDYEIFMAKRSIRQHLQVAPIDMTLKEHDGENVAHKASETLTDSSLNQAKIPPANDFAVHDNVECDACLMAPIVGFRYKCIQCPNYDLCQNCESKHIHPEHMMVRMPTNNCPNIVEAYVTGRTSGRKYNKRSKPSCPFVKNGMSIVNDDDAETPTTASENVEQSSPSNGKDRCHSRRHHRRHHRNNFFSHLYEMMNDLAEGGGAAAAAHAMGETTTTAKTTSCTTGPQTTTTTTTSSNNAGVENTNIENPIVAAAAAQLAAENSHKAAVKAADIALKVAHETAAKVAHETAVQAAKTVSENMYASSAPSTSAGAAVSDEKEKETSKEKVKVNATTSPREPEPQPNAVPIIPSPSLESLVQFLDPQYMKTGIQILNNFSDMFAKMLDPMETDDVAENQTSSNLRKNSTTSTKSSVASNLNSLGSGKKSDNEKFIEKEQNQEQTKETYQTGSDASSHVEIDDLGSDSENESVSESFIKLDAPDEGIPSPAKSATAASSTQTTPPRSLDKSNVMDFAQLSADLKAHIAQESAKESVKTVETTTEETVDNANGISAITSTTITSEPVVTTSSNTSNTTSISSIGTSNTAEPNKPQEKRAIPVYHTDQRINNAVIAMMSMGFSNEGAWLTQLLESVNGNISEALDLMTVAQRSGSR